MYNMKSRTVALQGKFWFILAYLYVNCLLFSFFPSYLLFRLPNKFEVGWCAHYRALLALDGMQKNVSTGGCLAYSILAKVNLACSNSCRDIHKLSHHDSPTLLVHSRTKMVHYRHPRLVHKFREGFISCCFSSGCWWLDFTNRLPFGLHNISSASLSTCVYHKPVRTMNNKHCYTTATQWWWPWSSTILLSQGQIMSTNKDLFGEPLTLCCVFSAAAVMKTLCGCRAGPSNEWLWKPH